MLSDVPRALLLVMSSAEPCHIGCGFCMTNNVSDTCTVQHAESDYLLLQEFKSLSDYIVGLSVLQATGSGCERSVHEVLGASMSESGAIRSPSICRRKYASSVSHKLIAWILLFLLVNICMGDVIQCKSSHSTHTWLIYSTVLPSALPHPYHITS